MGLKLLRRAARDVISSRVSAGLDGGNDRRSACGRESISEKSISVPIAPREKPRTGNAPDRSKIKGHAGARARADSRVDQTENFAETRSFHQRWRSRMTNS